MFVYDVAALYDTSLERSAVEFAVDYINQQVVVSPLYLSSTLNTSEVADNETSRRDAGNILIYLAR